MEGEEFFILVIKIISEVCIQVSNARNTFLNVRLHVTLRSLDSSVEIFEIYSLGKKDRIINFVIVKLSSVLVGALGLSYMGTYITLEIILRCNTLPLS